jgi:CheY-like chemotaxis protein
VPIAQDRQRLELSASCLRDAFFFAYLVETGGLMNSGLVLTDRFDGVFARKSATYRAPAPGRPTVLIATIDPEIREGLAYLLENAPVNAIWVSGVNDVKLLVASGGIAACLCGFWLQDGTYREVIRHLRRERLDIPTIIVSPRAYPQEYRDYLAAMNLEALDFLPYPYQQSDFQRMLNSAIGERLRSKDPGSPDSAFLHRGAA